MITYTITNSAFRDYCLTQKIKKLNAALTATHEQQLTSDPNAPAPTLWTTQSYIDTRLEPVFADWAAQEQDDVLAQVITAWPGISQAGRDQIASDLGYPEMSGQPANVSQKYMSILGVPAFKALTTEQQDSVFNLLGLK